VTLTEQLQIDGYISRVNPDIYPGVTNSKYDELLLELSQRGIAAMPHPTLMKVTLNPGISLNASFSHDFIRF
jgi:hypothetical protein